jgi:hypothetical protein
MASRRRGPNKAARGGEAVSTALGNRLDPKKGETCDAPVCAALSGLEPASVSPIPRAALCSALGDLVNAPSGREAHEAQAMGVL